MTKIQADARNKQELVNQKRSSLDRSLLAAFLLSGFAAMGYELLWTRLLSLSLGSETMGVLGALAGFFGGMMVGAYCLDAHAHKTKNPALAFVFLECGIALYALCSPHLLLWLARTMPPLIGPLAGDNESLTALALSLLIAGIVLLPATFCLGATLAYASEARRRAMAVDGGAKNIGRLYFANTLGGVLGVFASVYIIFPTCGLSMGAAWLSSVGFAAAAFAYRWHRLGAGREENSQTQKTERKISRSISSVSYKKTYLLLFLTGLAGIGLEVVLIHILAQLFENTIYTFANLLMVYLLGSAAGAWLSQRRAVRSGDELLVSKLLAWLVASILVAAMILCSAEKIFDWLRPVGCGLARNLLAELILSLLVFLLPTMLMGALFSRLAGRLSGHSVGRGYAFNTLGAALAPFIFGLVFIHYWGYAVALWGVAAVFLLAWMRAGHPVPLKQYGVAAVALLVLAGIAPNATDLISGQPGWVLVDKVETLYGTVIVTEQKGETGFWGQPLRRLQVNRNFRMGGGQGFAEMRMGHVPLLLQPNAKSLLYLGASTGTGLGAVKQYPLKKMEAVEIVPAVVGMMRWFRDLNFDVQNDPRVHMITADARRFTAASHEKYDLIIADLFHPGIDGAGSLYSLEHFRAMRDRLTEDGLAAQWLPLYELDPDDLKSVIKTFTTVFPETHAFLGIYNAETPILLLAGKKDGHFLKIDLGYTERNLRPDHPAYRVIANVNDFMAAYVTDKEGLAAFSRFGILNTDINPYVLFHAPRDAYLRTPKSRYASLEALLSFSRPPDMALMKFPGDRNAVNSYASILTTWRAAGKLMEANLAIAKLAPSEDVTPEIVRKLGEAYQLDPDFAPARGDLLQIAAASPLYGSMIRGLLNERDRARLRPVR
jgi:spermidine synthase